MLSAPIDYDNYKISEQSELAQILKKFGYDIKKEKLEAKMVNQLIGQKFKATVTHEKGKDSDVEYAKIIKESISRIG